MRNGPTKQTSGHDQKMIDITKLIQYTSRSHMEYTIMSKKMKPTKNHLMLLAADGFPAYVFVRRGTSSLLPQQYARNVRKRSKTSNAAREEINILNGVSIAYPFSNEGPTVCVDHNDEKFSITITNDSIRRMNISSVEFINLIKLGSNGIDDLDVCGWALHHALIYRRPDPYVEQCIMNCPVNVTRYRSMLLYTAAVLNCARSDVFDQHIANVVFAAPPEGKREYFEHYIYRYAVITRANIVGEDAYLDFLKNNPWVIHKTLY